RRSVELFETLGLPAPRSFIFPKHFMAHFDLLAKHGIVCYRGPEAGWFERLPHSLLRAAGRLAWARLRRPPKIGFPRRTSDGLWMIPSSQYYPGFQNVGKYISLADRVAKGKRGLDLAAKRKGVHHLWTHPFNLGQRTDELISGLSEILRHAGQLRDAGKMCFASMGELAGQLAASPANPPLVKAS
ncbi:MAG: hypothetical protein MI861_11385, partial [Pirellulales bacterium]|nr:hypothetical protein [Pirellulales bacterium]